jgi:acyl-CoA reductase-like NAD-dependent aldehyde dehydrogenase
MALASRAVELIYQSAPAVKAGRRPLGANVSLTDPTTAGRTESPLSTQLLIDGSFRDAASGRASIAISPASGDPIGPVAEGDAGDAAGAVQAAARAFPAWAAETPFARAEAMHRVAEACERRRDELAWVLTLDQGKPLAESRDEVQELVAMWHAAAEDAIRLEGRVASSVSAANRVLLVRRAVGPVAVVTPWNWPYTMPGEIIAPALAAGNTVAWTPAPTTAACSGVLARCVAEADLPPGVFNFVTGPGPVVGDALVGDPATAGVGFIGSTTTGLTIARRAAGKRLLLEMGGNGPLVVLDDADIDAAVAATLTACFLCAGQSCTAGERILVHRAVYDEYVEKLARAVTRQIVLGDPFAPETTMGPLNNEPVAVKMDEHVADAIQRGAETLTGGSRASAFPTDLYWEPTVLAGVPADSRVATEETFGPVAPVVEITSLEHAITLANDGPYGLLAAIYTADLARGLEFADRVRTGWVNINESTNYWEAHLPFGGRSGTDSGNGKVGGNSVMQTFTELQTIVLSPHTGA